MVVTTLSAGATLASVAQTKAAAALPFCTEVSAARTFVIGTIFGSSCFHKPMSSRYFLV